MKTLVKFLLVVGCFGMTSCFSTVTKHNLADGFFIKSTTPLLENSGGGRELRYRSAEGRQKVVWKYVDDPVLIHNGTAVFIGWLEESKERSGNTYLAVKINGSVVAIAKAVLTRAASKSGAQPEEYFKRYVEYELRAKDDIVQFEFATRGVNQPDFLVELTWDEISEIVDTVTKTGKPHKDKVSGLTYLE
jgi:hypothetical protein